MNLIEQIVSRLSDDQIVVGLNNANAKLDEYAACGLDTNDPALRRENLLVSALRSEYRARTGEVI